MLLFSLYKVASFLLSGENKEKRLSKILFRVLGHGTPLVLLNFKIVRAQRYQKEFVREACSSLIVFLREALFKEWLQAYYVK